jgi:ATP-dependent Clp protease protease subunit
MLYLSSEDENLGMFLYMNSSGGSIICRLSLVDTIQYIHSRVGTVNVGIAGSIAAFVLSSGKKGKRIALPHARFIIHQPEGGGRGQATEIFIEVNEVIRIRGIVKRLYSEFTGKTLDFITLGMNRDEFLNAKQACEYGIIDLIGKYARYSTTPKKN